MLQGFKGGFRDSFDEGGSVMEQYKNVISIIDGTNCSPKAVLACRSVNLVFISFSLQSRKGTVIDFLKQSSGPSAYLSLFVSRTAYSRFFNLYVQQFTDFNTLLKTLAVDLLKLPNKAPLASATGIQLMACNATLNNISVIPWMSVLLVDETRVPE